MRAEKKSMIEEIERRVSASAYMLLADYRGLKVEQMKELRARLGAVGARMQVVNNRLLRRVAEGRSWMDLPAALRGPTAMVTGGEVTDAAKVLKTFTGENNKLPAVKGGVLGNAPLVTEDIGRLASLPGREVLLAQLVGTMAAPISRLSGVMRQKAATIVYVLKAVEEKKKSA